MRKKNAEKTGRIFEEESRLLL